MTVFRVLLPVIERREKGCKKRRYCGHAEGKILPRNLINVKDLAEFLLGRVRIKPLPPLITVRV